MTKILSALALSFLLATAATAAERPRLRAEVTVSSDLVRLGDLVEGAGAAANEALFRAPDLGTTGTVQTPRVQAAAGAKKVEDIDTQGLAEVAVTRASRPISLDEISRTIVLAITRQNGIPDDSALSLSFDPTARPAHIEPGITAPLQVTRIQWSPATGRFDALLSVEGSTLLSRAPLRIGGIAQETISVPVFTRALTRGETVRAADVSIERQPRTASRTNAVAALSDAVGQAVRRNTRPGQPVLLSDLTKPEVVARNDGVTLVYEVPGMILSVRAKALEAGAEGDTVAVLNAQSNRVVQATVTGPGRVAVITRPRLALN